MTTFQSVKLRKGFTLIELIIVVAIIAIIAATVFVALDPGKRLHVSRNSRRWADVTAVAKAVRLYETDNAGLPSGIDLDASSVQMLGTASACPPADCTGVTFPGSNCFVSLTSDLSTYLKGIPLDPLNGTDSNTRYYVNRNGGVITVGACDAEGESAGGSGTAPTISVSQ